MTHSSHQFIGWPFNGCSPDDWTYSDHCPAGLAKHISDTWNGQDGTDADNRVARGDEDGLSLFQSIEYTWGWFCFVSPNKYDILYFLTTAAFHQIFFKVQKASW